MQFSFNNIQIIKRDYKLDVLKVIGCLLVILLHCKGLVIRTDGTINYNNLLIESFTAPCVEIFFLTSGFYLYKENGTYLDKLKRLLFNIVIPYIIFCFICLNLTDWLLGIKNIQENFQSNSVKENLNSLWFSLRYNTADGLPNTLNHLWYIFSYIEIILFYPISKWFVQKCNKYVRNAVLIICFFFMLQNDYRLLTGNDWMYNIFFHIPKAITISVMGHVLFNDFIKKDYIKNKKFALVIFTMISIALMVLSYYMQAYYYEHGGVYYFDSWDSCITFVRTVILCVMVYLMDLKENKFVSYIAQLSFYIYLIHYVILQRFLVRYVDEHFRSKCSNTFQDFAFAILFFILVTVTTILVCTVLHEIVFNIKLLIKKSKRTKAL